MKSSERHTEPKENCNEVFSTTNKKHQQFHLIKSNKEVTLKTQETYFLYRKRQKLQISKNSFRKLFSKKNEKLLLLDKSHSVEKTKTGHLSQK